MTIVYLPNKQYVSKSIKAKRLSLKQVDTSNCCGLLCKIKSSEHAANEEGVEQCTLLKLLEKQHVCPTDISCVRKKASETVVETANGDKNSSHSKSSINTSELVTYIGKLIDSNTEVNRFSIPYETVESTANSQHQCNEAYADIPANAVYRRHMLY